MTLQDLSLSDLTSLHKKYFDRWTHSKSFGLTDEQVSELRRRLDLISSEENKREELLFFKS